MKSDMLVRRMKHGLNAIGKRRREAAKQKAREYDGGRPCDAHGNGTAAGILDCDQRAGSYGQHEGSERITDPVRRHPRSPEWFDDTGQVSRRSQNHDGRQEEVRDVLHQRRESDYRNGENGGQHDLLPEQLRQVFERLESVEGEDGGVRDQGWDMDEERDE